MMRKTEALHLPNYYEFIYSIAELNLSISVSELHGIMCGYLCAGEASKGETYLRALFNNKIDPEKTRPALLALFAVFAISQQQMLNFDFEFQLLVPDDTETLLIRAQAFSEWCDGFTQGFDGAGASFDQLQEEEAKEAMQHLMEFAQLDYESLDVEEDDERALLEVSEYARMAVLRIFSDLNSDSKGKGQETAH